jgi:hypothetical protein
MLPQEVARPLGLKRRASRQTLEEQDAGRIQVRPGAWLGLHQTGLLGRDVSDRSDRQVPDRRAQAVAAREAEVDDRGLGDRAIGIDDQVGGLEVAVEHTVAVDVAERLEQAAAEGEGVRKREGAAPQAFLHRHARDIGRHERQAIVLLGPCQQRRHPPAVESGQHRRFMGQARLGVAR